MYIEKLKKKEIKNILDDAIENIYYQFVINNKLIIDRKNNQLDIK